MDTLTLDGQPISQEALREKLKDTTIKIVEVSPGQFKTLKVLKG